MRLPHPYSLEETLEKLRHGLTTASNQAALALLEKAVTKARNDRVYAKQFEEALLRGSTIEIRECLSAALATTSSVPETHSPITRTTMPSTALIMRPTPSCLMLRIPTYSRITNNIRGDHA
ncbi:hypothetical protein [Aeromonas sobria]|uniref:hypothetical protein n=1 Tax=Aeromonas sobria TaxID=646 RepID=UPI0026EE9971|nr:hypothetical protein [Aeromonas sobria]